MNISNLPAYRLIKEEKLSELNGTGYILEHEKTKARVVIVENDDENKVFHIGFRTPPADDTGVPHIMEHSVLCGSKKFPAKDPFIELAKGSLNTFLNAMTYSDKTVYPIASCNAQDFHNLMHVYLDAVFYPNIYERTEIMRQEGWHYDIDSPDGELAYNGVVYNEMKGVYSSPEDVLAREIQASLLPDTIYRFESGGDPDHIPELTQEDFIKFHQTYYHPSNSYIYLYGDADMEKELAFLDEEYLSHYSYLFVDSEIKKQEPFKQPVTVRKTYSIGENQSEMNNTYLCYNVVIDTSLNRRLYLAFQILQYVLLDIPGAPVKKMLVDAGIGKDVYGSFDNGLLQPIFTIMAKGANKEQEQQFVDKLKEILQSICENGIGEKTLRAAINLFEFRIKESDFGSYPKGLIQGLKMFDSWLYDDMSPFIHLQTEDTFAYFKEVLTSGYFENLIKEYFLDNKHCSVVVYAPEKGLQQKKEEAFHKHMEEVKSSFSREQLEQMISEKQALEKYQSEPSTKEELEKIPMLSIEDLDKKERQFHCDVRDLEGAKLLMYKAFTNQIDYVSWIFTMGDLSQEYYPYVSLLTTVLQQVDTEHYSYNELSNEINLVSGGIRTSVTCFSSIKEKETSVVPGFIVKSKTLPGQFESAVALIKEILSSSHLEDEKRIKELIEEQQLYYQEYIKQSGHTMSVTRTGSYFDEKRYFMDMTSGIGYYEFLSDIVEHMEEALPKVTKTLAYVLEKILCVNNLMLSYTGDRENIDFLSNGMRSMKEILCDRSFGEEKPLCVRGRKNEGFESASQVQYAALAGNFRKNGLMYSGALEVLQVIFSYEYLWNEVRVKGGAYGCMNGFDRFGFGYFTSYRDPNLERTYEVYKKAVDFTEHFDADERDMTKYIIGAIAKRDQPLSPMAKGAVAIAQYMTGLTDEELQKTRDEILSATPDTIRAQAPIIKEIVDQNYRCAIGNEQKIKENRDLFLETKAEF